MSLDRSNSISEGGSWTYEDTVTKAEQIVSQIESGKLSLADLFTQFSLASDYLQQCEEFLQRKRQEMDLSVENLDSSLQA